VKTHFGEAPRSQVRRYCLQTDRGESFLRSEPPAGLREILNQSGWAGPQDCLTTSLKSNSMS